MKIKVAAAAALMASLFPALAQAQIVVGPVSTTTQQVPVGSPWFVVALTLGLACLAVKFRHKLANKGGVFCLAVMAIMGSQVDWVGSVDAASGSKETIVSNTTQTIDIVGTITTIENRSGAGLQVKSITFQIDDGVNPPEACTQDRSAMLGVGEHHCDKDFVIPDGEDCTLRCDAII